VVFHNILHHHRKSAHSLRRGDDCGAARSSPPLESEAGLCTSQVKHPKSAGRFLRCLVLRANKGQASALPSIGWNIRVGNSLALVRCAHIIGMLTHVYSKCSHEDTYQGTAKPSSANESRPLRCTNYRPGRRMAIAVRNLPTIRPVYCDQ
jgi:hypothetical protein